MNNDEILLFAAAVDADEDSDAVDDALVDDVDIGGWIFCGNGELLGVEAFETDGFILSACTSVTLGELFVVGFPCLAGTLTRRVSITLNWSKQNSISSLNFSACFLDSYFSHPLSLLD